MRRYRHTNDFHTELEAIAKKRVRKIKSFFIHLFVFGIVFTIFILKRYCNIDFKFLPLQHINWFFMTIWFFFVCVKGIKLLVREVILGKEWENRQMDKFMQSESQNQKWK